MTSQNTTALTTFDGDFGAGEGADFVVKPTQMVNPRIQWMTGKLHTTTMEPAIGGHIPVGVNPTIDEILSRMETKQYIVQHESTDPHGESKQIPYWALN